MCISVETETFTSRSTPITNGKVYYAEYLLYSDKVFQESVCLSPPRFLSATSDNQEMSGLRDANPKPPN